MQRYQQSGRLLLLAGVVLLGSLLLTGSRTSHAQQESTCFAETDYCITGRIAEYWQQNGGLPVFGLPITPQREEVIEGQTLQVQWFERNRLELHPDNAPPYDVLLGRLGAERLNQQFAAEQPRSACRYFAETGYNVCGAILLAWRADGLELDGQAGKTEAENLALFGLPISPEYQTTLSDGNTYTVQYFERARFELHPENAPPFDVLLGLLGRETLESTPPAAFSIATQGDDWAFDQVRLGEVGAGQQTTVTFDNTSAVYEHNWVLLNTDDEATAFAFNRAAGQAGAANDYLPTGQADRAPLVVATRLLQAGESDSVTFAAPAAAGQYIYLCTVPGHYQAGMHGMLVVEP